MSAEINVLSAGAVKPGLVKVIDTYQHETGHKIEVTFATAPAIRKRLNNGEMFDLIIAPVKLLDELPTQGNTKGADRSTVGLQAIAARRRVDCL